MNRLARLARLARSIRSLIAASEKRLKFISGKHGIPLETVVEMDQVDPTLKGTYIEWMARNLKEGKIQWPDDSSRLQTALQSFMEITNKKNFREQYNIHPDLNRYSLQDLEQVSQTFHGVSGVKPESLKKQFADTLKVYDDGEYAILKPQNVEAICSLAPGTKWCTSQPDAAKNYMKDGGVYVIYKNGRKYAQTDGSSLRNTSNIDLRDDQLALLLLREEILVGLGATSYARHVKKGRWVEAEPFILQDPELAYSYASQVLGDRWPEAEPTILQDPKSAVRYSYSVLKGRWPEAEPTILQDPKSAYEYALRIIKDRWTEAEPTILQDPKLAYEYARSVIKGRWPEAEPTILQDPESAVNYSHMVLKDRWPEAEPLIIRDPELAFKYAKFTIKGRWPEAEPIIKQDPKLWRGYLNYFPDARGPRNRS